MAAAPSSTFDVLVASDLTVEECVARLLDELDEDERLSCLAGEPVSLAGLREMAVAYNARPIPAGAIPRLGIPGIRFADGPRGVVLGRSTAFPVSMGRGASFDVDLEERIGEAIGREARAQGANLFAGVCINLLRHPGWGRAQETYGEDTHHLGEMGRALTRGAGRHVMTCIKHFAANSVENSRFWVDVEVDRRDLDDLYLPHFAACVEEGADMVMSAYNSVNGAYCSENRELLTEVLRDEWGFDGAVMSDFTFGVRGSAARSLIAGLDLEMPHRMRYARLGRLVRRGALDRSVVDTAVRRLLRVQVRAARRTAESDADLSMVAGEAHRALAHEAAVKAMVLLRNEGPVLPLDGSRLERVAVLGRLARQVTLGDKGSSMVRAPDAVTLLQGLEAAGARDGFTVSHDDGDDPATAAARAREAEVAIVVVGNDHRSEGEWVGVRGGDRAELGLSASHEALVRSVASSGTPTVVVLVGGSALLTEGWREEVGALLVAWYPGIEGGRAVADVLLGREVPGGRLPSTWAAAAADLPPFRRIARRIRYGPLHGYRLAEASGVRPAFPFGFGLGYSEVAWGDPRLQHGLPAPAGRRGVRVEVDLQNVGDRDAVEVVQLYVPERLGSDVRARRTLRAFQRVELAPGEQRTVTVERDVPAAADRVFVGRSSAQEDLAELLLG